MAAGMSELIPGLCGTCKHCHAVTNSRGSTFFMCRRAETDDGFARYPPLPVRQCAGFETDIAIDKKGDLR